MSAVVTEKLAAGKPGTAYNPSNVTVELRLRIEELYAHYAACLDEARYVDWPAFFTEACVYKVMPRENYDRGLQLATMAAESRGMLVDRAYGIQNTLFHQPYYQRHLVSGLLVRGVEENAAGGPQGRLIRTQANYAVFRTKQNALSEVFNVGRYIDTLVEEDGVLKFREKLCIFDSELIPNSLIYPL
jgi:salicylate 5-hydroxylase small subunit